MGEEKRGEKQKRGSDYSTTLLKMLPQPCALLTEVVLSGYWIRPAHDFGSRLGSSYVM